MKKYFLTSLVLILIILPLSAQKNIDVLYLKNGSKIFGKMIEVTNDHYKIQTSEGSVFVFSASEVEKFVNEEPAFDGRKKSGVGFVLEAGIMAGVKTTDYSTPFSFNALLNLTGRTTSILGVGSGVEYIGQPYMPLFLEYKQLTSEKNYAPFFFIRAGNLFHIKGDDQSTDSYYYNPNNYEKKYHGGFTFTLGTGVSWVKNNCETYLSFAYRNAHFSYDQLDYNKNNNTYKTNLNRLEIKLGFRF
jgi:hypothetical protein